MLITAIVAVLVAGLLGLATKAGLSVLGRRNIVSDQLRISGVEFTAAFLAAALVVMPVTLEIGKSMSVSAILTDNEFYNGVELKPTVRVTQCYGGHSDAFSDTAGESNCTWTYVSGQYYYHHETCSTDSNGKSHCTDDSRWIDIYTPYATAEYTYKVSDTLGQTYTYPDTYVATDAKPYSNQAIPGSIPRGTPPDWQDAMNRWQAGNPRPVTAVFHYENPILALRAQSGIDEYDTPAPDSVVNSYLKRGLIPDHTANVLTNPIKGGSNGRAQTVANKAGFVCATVPKSNQQAWQDQLMQFNAQLGTHLQGDLHLLIVGDCISDLHDYTKAVKTYWQGPHFGKSPLSKNGIVVVLQTLDGKTISAADATTGMPFGNNGMINSIRTYLPGTALSPRDVLGDPHTFVSEDGKTKRYTESSPAGSLEGIVLFGQYAFHRDCMISCPAGEHSYGDLIAQIEPSTSARVWMVVIVGVVSLVFWLIVAKTDFLDRFWECRFGKRKTRKEPPSPSYLDDASTDRTHR